MLFHHDGRDANTAATEAAIFARAKFNRMLDGGQKKAQAVIERILSTQPVDRVVKARVIDFVPDEQGIFVQAGDSFREKLHPHALQQATSEAGVPWGFAQELLSAEKNTPEDAWGKALLAKNLKEIFEKVQAPADKKFLTRSVDQEVRGFLSDKYKRLDSRPLVEAFAEACAGVGALPIDGEATDTRVWVEAALPTIYEPVPNEVMIFGLKFGNSDFGRGALSVRAFCNRLWCTNKAITEECMRQIHLGRRLSDDMVFSEETYRLDTATSASAIRDIVKGALDAPKIEAFQGLIRRANEEKVSARDLAGWMKKLNKSEAEKVEEAFNGPDVEMLPVGETKWRLSNALSWVAGKIEDVERKVELQQMAGQLLAA